MAKQSGILGLAMLSGLGFFPGLISGSVAATSTTLDIVPDDMPGAPAASVEVGGIRPLTGQMRSTAKPTLSGNPLWSVPLSALTATQERPLFSMSRRPPPKAVIGPRIEPAAPAPVVERPAERPSLALVGLVVGYGEAIAVFLDRTSQRIVRLRQGEAYSGWVLTSVLQGEATLKKAEQTEVLVLPRTIGLPASSEPNGMPVVPAQTSGNTGTPYAPFVPQHTPKNGEHDGL